MLPEDTSDFALAAISGAQEEDDYFPPWDAWSPMSDWAPRMVRVYYLEITYPPGSRKPGWLPAVFRNPEVMGQFRRSERRAMRKQWHWPRERMFLSRSSAYERAGILRIWGATVTVHRSRPVLWPARAPDDAEVRFDPTGLRMLEY
jgi:hypothetical protein